ncbi:MAG TPA: hypothetical protein VNZ22_20350, partial [Bacillota bacterium]|nr:hypothetical protein [Bacillota bacterium]
SGRALMDKADEQAASAKSIRRIDTSEQTTTLLMGQQRLAQPPQTNVVRIELDRPGHLARQTATVQGQELVLLKQGEQAALKLGTGPWKVPAGPFAEMAKAVGDLFVCERETPETQKNAPVWKVAGTEVLAGQEAFVVETEGNTAAALAQERMVKGMAKHFSANPAQQPEVKVLEYASKHWISKADFRRLQAVQRSKVQITVALAEGTKQVVENVSKTTSQYSFDPVSIEIPAEAQKILSNH